MAPRPLGKRFLLSGTKLLSGCCAKGSRSVIHGTGQHARKGKRHVVLGGAPAAPFIVLQPENGFPGDKIGPGTLQAVRLVGSVKVDQEPMLGGLACYT